MLEAEGVSDLVSHAKDSDLDVGSRGIVRGVIIIDEDKVVIIIAIDCAAEGIEVRDAHDTGNAEPSHDATTDDAALTLAVVGGCSVVTSISQAEKSSAT